MDDFDDHYEEEGGDDEYAVATYEHVLFLIDAGRGMMVKSGLESVQGFKPEDTFMDVALQCVAQLMKSHIIGNPKNNMAVSFYGAGSCNTEIVGAVHAFQEMDELCASRILAVEELGPQFEKEIGSAKNVDNAKGLEDGLWHASDVLSKAPIRAGRRVIIFTTQEDPCGGNEEGRERVMTRAQALRDAKAEVEIFNLTPEGQEFSMDFWERLAGDPEETAAGVAPVVQPMRIEDIWNNLKMRTYKKRALTTWVWTLGPLGVGVKLYSLLSKASKARAVMTDLSNRPLRSTGAYICQDTGATLERIDKFVFHGGKSGTHDNPRFPGVVVDAGRRSAIRGSFEAGLKLLGFKSMATLKDYDQLRPSSFLYPDEVGKPGSTRALTALHSQLVSRQQYALCQVVRTALSEPRLAAVVPQEELIIEETQEQLQPPGFNMIWLPYRDDERRPEADTLFLGAERPPAPSKVQIEAGTAMLKKLQLGPDFVAGTVPNPHLQRHYQVVESLAFDREVPEFIIDDDLTLPDDAGLQAKALKHIVAFRNSIYGEGFDGVPKPKKRKAEDDAPIDWLEMAKAGTLSNLTLDPLKAYCTRNKLAKGGRKDEIVERIMAHLLGP